MSYEQVALPPLELCLRPLLRHGLTLDPVEEEAHRASGVLELDVTKEVRAVSSLGDGQGRSLRLRLNGRLSVIEHKHMKEGGGGQDKQIGELIDFIRQNDPQVSYISFLDGVYFNELAVADQSERKSRAQLNQIRQALRANRYNYFVNTAGFLHRLALNRNAS